MVSTRGASRKKQRRRTASATAIMVTLAMLATSEAFGQCDQEFENWYASSGVSGQVLMRTGNVPSVFTVDKDGPNVYENSKGDKTRNAASLRLAARYFAMDCTYERLLIVKLWDLEPIGWVDTTDVIERTWQPLTVEELKGHRIVAPSEGATVLGVRESEQISVRVVTQPGSRVHFGKRPGETGGEHTGLMGSWRWYYLFDVERDENDDEWLLVGDIPELVTHGDTDQADILGGGGKFGLRGWVPAKQMTIWTTNLLLELNTGRRAVQWREEKGEPALVLQVPHVDSAPTFTEPLEQFWREIIIKDEHGNSKTVPGTMQPFGDPAGMPGSFTRHMVLANDDRYFEVASAASRDGSVLMDAKTDVRAKLESAVREMTAIDVVFLIDRSGSMERAIDETISLLKEIVDGLVKHRKGGQMIHVPSLDYENQIFTMTTDLDVYVSAFSYEKTVKPLLPPTELVENWETVRRVMEFLKQRLEGGTELVHPAILKVLESNAWRPFSFERLIVLITDERGDVEGGTRQAWKNKVLAAMPDVTDIKGVAIDGIPGLAKKSTNERKRMLTTIVAVYLDKDETDVEQNVREFKKNMKGIATPEPIRNFRRSDDARSVRSIVTGHLDRKKHTVKERIGIVEAILNNSLTEDAARVWRSSGGLAPAGMWAALERNDLTEEQVKDLGSLVYYEGYVPTGRVLQETPKFEDDGHDTAVEDGEVDKVKKRHFRIRVMLNRDEVRAMANAAGALSEALKRSLSVVCEGETESDGECLSTKGYTPQEIVLRAYTAAAMAIRGDTVEQSRLNEEIEKLMRDARLGKVGYDVLVEGVPNLKRLFAGALPIRMDGLLGRKVEDVLKEGVKWLRREGKRLEGIEFGLTRVLQNGLAITENPVHVKRLGAVQKPQGWWHRIHPLGQIKVAYIPVGYIP